MVLNVGVVVEWFVLVLWFKVLQAFDFSWIFQLSCIGETEILVQRFMTFKMITFSTQAKLILRQKISEYRPLRG